MKAPCDNPHGAFCWMGIQDCSSQSSVLLEGVKDPGLGVETNDIKAGEYNLSHGVITYGFSFDLFTTDKGIIPR